MSRGVRPAHPASIDLNADLGEECADDDALLDIVTSANVATGAHAGGGDVLVRTVRAAARRHVAIGAHPSYPDRDGFGRMTQAGQWSSDDLQAEIVRQCLRVQGACAEAGVALAHLKPHGALYNDAACTPWIADAVAQAAAALKVPLVGLPATEHERAAERAGIDFHAEAFVDRAYRDDGTLVPRGEPGAVLAGAAAVDQALALAVHGAAATLCLHGDTPDSVVIARSVRAALEDAGIVITAIRADPAS